MIDHTHFHHLVVADKNAAFRNSLLCFDMLLPDGIGVYLASKFLYGNAEAFTHRHTGTDFYFQLLKRANKKHWKIFFLGGKQEMLDALQVQLRKKYPNITIAGVHHGFFPFEDRSVLDEIASSNADILFAGMGVPRQELWLHHHKNELNVPVCFAVGAGMDFVSGYQKRAPQRLQRAGFEWLYRLLHEPRRLWKRYLIGIPSFIIFVIRCKFRQKNYVRL
ncbi:MAG: WecB/TagA/CpsF family glycosyltransferase [Bacteroidota bacterium]|nr:WecB/TagA/CpsF family glycosyltransferase [Bacteroidota bacterium]